MHSKRNGSDYNISIFVYDTGIVMIQGENFASWETDDFVSIKQLVNKMITPRHLTPHGVSPKPRIDTTTKIDSPLSPNVTIADTSLIAHAADISRCLHADLEATDTDRDKTDTGDSDSQPDSRDASARQEQLGGLAKQSASVTAANTQTTGDSDSEHDDTDSSVESEADRETHIAHLMNTITELERSKTILEETNYYLQESLAEAKEERTLMHAKYVSLEEIMNKSSKASLCQRKQSMNTAAQDTDSRRPATSPQPCTSRHSPLHSSTTRDSRPVQRATQPTITQHTTDRPAPKTPAPGTTASKAQPAKPPTQHAQNKPQQVSLQPRTPDQRMAPKTEAKCNNHRSLQHERHGSKTEY